MKAYSLSQTGWILKISQRMKSKVVVPLILCLILSIHIILSRKSSNVEISVSPEVIHERFFLKVNENITHAPPKKENLKNWRNLSDSEIAKLSILGRRLFLYEDVGTKKNKTFVIHVWKQMEHISKRFLNRYTDTWYDPFEFCSVRNCNFTSKDEDVTNADAVLFHLARTLNPPSNVPRRPGQIWVWLSDESPNAVFLEGGDKTFSHYNGFFNWSMTYRMDSDVPVPYGRTLPLLANNEHKDTLFQLRRKTKGIALLGSHCFGHNRRYVYIRELKKHISIDVYGKCGKKDVCPGHFRKNCDVIDDYKIYIAFENNNCDDYLTEKVSECLIMLELGNFYGSTP